MGDGGDVMRLSYFANIVDLGDGKYLLLRPGSPPLVVDRDVVDVLNDPSKAPDDVVDVLSRHGILTDLLPEEERALAFSLFGNGSSGVGRYSVAITYNCNFACVYCYERKIKKENTITLEMVDKFYEIATSKLKEGRISRNIGITGGEPLMNEHADVLEYILSEGKRRGFAFDVISNGYELVDFVDLLRKNNVLAVKVTIDGPREIHNRRRIHINRSGTFDRILEGVKAATEKGITITIFVNVDSQNVESIPELVSSLREEDVDSLILLKRVNERSGVRYPFALSPEEYFARVFRIIREHNLHNVGLYEFDVFYSDFLNAVFGGKPIPGRLKYCGATQGDVMIFDPRGDLYPCDYLLGNRSFRIGTYFPEFKLNRNHLLWSNRSADRIPKCFGCKLAPICAGGCPMEAYARHGTIYAPYCDEFRYLFEYVKLKLSMIAGRDKND